jgi:hypothetical protein
MNVPVLQLQHAQPLDITHHARWLDILLDKPPATSSNAAPPLPSLRGLRTLVAVRPEQLEAADELVRRRYSWRGYRLSATEKSESAGAQAERFTLLAESCGRLLATLTVRPESPLLAENTYGSEIESLRREGRRIGELVKLAVEEGADWKAGLDALVQSAWLITRIIHALTDVVIEVNPRHVRFHQRIFGFVVAAAGGVCSRVGAPSVLMRLDLEAFGRRLQLSGRAM